MMRRGLALVLLLSVAQFGCLLGPDYRQPDDLVGLAMEEYRQQKGSDESLANLPWWDLFEDPALQDLIRTALAENKDILASFWRIEEARSRLGFTRADQWPSFTYEGSARTTQPTDQPVERERFETYTLSAGVSWEIDVFGKLRRSTQSARAQLLATEWGHRAVTVALVSDVARLYFLLRDLDGRLAIARRTLDSRRGSTELIRKRFRGGVVSELDVRQAEIEEAIAAAAVPLFERQVVQAENALSVLVGRPPGEILRGQSLVEQNVPLETPAGLPSELLQRRPDVVRAEALLQAQMARVGVAQALRWPSLSLTGFLGFESQELSELIDSDTDTWSLGGSLLGPIFEFGKNKRRVEIERALTEQVILEYEKAVLNAFREVEDALVGVRTLREEYEARLEQVEAAQQAAKLSRARYDGGVTSYLEVLDIERSLFDAELQASRTLQESYAAVVSLYAALGGGWDSQEPILPEPQVPRYSEP
jgi:multidrug efflux system outer membrane protein